LQLRGSIASGPPRAAVTKWRDDGGTIEIEELELDWRPLRLTGSGTLALDAELQPQAALTATIAGYGEIVDSLLVAGAIKPNDGALAKIALGLLAKPGPSGERQITAPIAVQEGRLFVGPVRLMTLPKISWD